MMMQKPYDYRTYTNKRFNIILQIIALVCINGLAFVYDGQYIPLSVGIDALILGINLRPQKGD